MTWLSWVLLTGYIALSFALYRLFPKADTEARLALIPGYNMWVVAKLVGRNPLYSLLLLIPFLNVFIFASLMVDLARSFGRFGFLEHVAAVLGSWGYFFWLSNNEYARYDGPILVEERAYRKELAAVMKTKDKREINRVKGKYDKFDKPFYQDWAEAAVFAIFAAAFIRLLLIESYIIPTPSMEGNLNVGDFLFVSKIHYGMRLPETILMLPLVHNRSPFGGESYLEKPNLPFRRLPAIDEIERYDPVVFNVPAGDSVYVTPGRVYYTHDLVTGEMPGSVYQAIQSGQLDLITRPRDKKDHYIKRAVGLPGETLEVRDRKIVINGEVQPDPENIQFLYQVEFSQAPNTRNWADMGISSDDYQSRGLSYFMYLSDEQLAEVKTGDPGATATIFEPPVNPVRLYPHSARYFGEWTNDNYGPVLIPARGMTIELDDRTYPLYERAIRAYEGNDSFVKEGNQYLLNGQPINSYTFKQDYFWMMGDNRHNSEDSRVWGFVPRDHVLGKPLFIWFSIKEGNLFNGINWDRIFRSASKQGD